MIQIGCKSVYLSASNHNIVEELRVQDVCHCVVCLTLQVPSLVSRHAHARVVWCRTVASCYSRPPALPSRLIRPDVTL